MITFKQFLVTPTEQLREGFMGFSVGGSDSASDLEYTVTKAVKAAKAQIKKETGGMAPKAGIEAELVDVIIKELEVGLKDKGNAYNTHGTLNVAMVMDEYYREYRRFPAYNTFAKKVAAKLKAEAKDRSANDYTEAMTDFADKLLAWAK
jgi:hypothetical protein